MSRCVVKPICEEHSGCLKEEPSCPYAAKFGFSIHCEHPDHRQMAAESVHSLGRLELTRRYRELRESRRRNFIADLGMPMQECVTRIVNIIKKDYPEPKVERKEEPVEEK
ncbi:hypothetical protein [Geomesophilobacter sediminis]|uniref:Uncharacterized protein n=1 Tax=Geomesophilobacter sediminis TaxID=2798584 RepID=A0A8J7M0P7_9BACT|nr:hypothetical protein [Geomesophilobacter sediminis]MBJ6726297.1 hypothetical protein [Geomesophilobacter sediminis]